MAVIEHVLLPVRAGQAAAFEQAMTRARPLIAASPGFMGLALHAPVDDDCPYLLLVTWADVESHRDGFRQSERYQRWREQLHHFYDELPAVRYFGENLS
jgi:heme-degrading monooxygenase HmoA